MRIGFIGTGIMGTGMVANLLNDGHEVVLYNRTPEKAAALVTQGAAAVDSPAALGGQKLDLLITMVAHPAAVEAVALGADGFLDALPAGTLWIDSTTVHPAFARRMAGEATSRGIRFLDAPVTGTKPQAADGVLTFIIGGDAADIEFSRSVLESMGSRIVHVGGHGMGTSLKVVLNHMLAISMEALAEGMVLGQALGIDEETLFNVLLAAPVTAPALGRKREMMTSGDYSDTEFPLALMQKDLHMATTAAYDVGVAMPLANAAKETYQLAARNGWGDADLSAIYQYLKDETRDGR